MATKLTKPVIREIEINGKIAIVELSHSGLTFRLPRKRDRAKISWDLLLNLIPKSEWCKDANRSLRMFLGIPGKLEDKMRGSVITLGHKVTNLEMKNRRMRTILKKYQKLASLDF